MRDEEEEAADAAAALQVAAANAEADERLRWVAQRVAEAADAADAAAAGGAALQTATAYESPTKRASERGAMEAAETAEALCLVAGDAPPKSPASPDPGW